MCRNCHVLSDREDRTRQWTSITHGTSVSPSCQTGERFMVLPMRHIGRWREMFQSNRKLQRFRAQVHRRQKDLYGEAIFLYDQHRELNVEPPDVVHREKLH